MPANTLIPVTMTVDGYDFAVTPAPMPEGELPTWLDEPVLWGHVHVGDVALHGHLSAVTTGEGRRWRVPLLRPDSPGRAHAYVFTGDLSSALLLLQRQDADLRIAATVRPMAGRGLLVTAPGDRGPEPRTFRLVLDVEAYLAGTPVVDIREHGITIVRARPYIGRDLAVWWHAPHDTREFADPGYDLASLDELISVARTWDPPRVTTGALRSLIGELDAVQAHAVDLAGSLTGGEHDALGLGALPDRLDDERARLGRAITALERLAARPAEACQSPTSACPDHGLTLRILGAGAALVTVCGDPRCDRGWDHDRLGAPCDALAVWRATAPNPGPVLEPQDFTRAGGADSVRVCVAHGTRLIGWGWSVATLAGDALADEVLAVRCREAARVRSGLDAATRMLTELGYRVEEIPADPAYLGMNPPIELRIFSDRFSTRATWRLNPSRGVYVFTSGMVPNLATPFGTHAVERWATLIEILGNAAELPERAAELMPAIDGQTRAEREQAASDAGWRYVSALTDAGYAATPREDGGDHLIIVAGHDHEYRLLLLDDVTVEQRVFAGAWHVSGDLGELEPVTWSTWPAFLAHLGDVAAKARA